MNLSRNNIIALGLQGAIGAILATSLGALSLYVERRSGAMLQVTTEALHTDRALLAACRELERRIAALSSDVEVHYLECVNAMDQIVKIRMELTDRSPTPKDKEIAFQQFARLIQAMTNMRKMAKREMNIREQLDLKKLCERMCNGPVDAHLKAITVLTKYVAPPSSAAKPTLKQSNTMKPTEPRTIARPPKCSVPNGSPKGGAKTNQ